jgi:nicotinate-nucleotide pyrophosphorylase (carboxylating)
MDDSQREIDEKLRELLAEDVGSGDVTTDSTVAADLRARGALLARSGSIVSGLPVARRVFELLDFSLEWHDEIPAGGAAPPGAVLAHLAGRAREILTAERVALNLLQRMCGIATATRRFVDAVAGTGCRILDTRKTAPGLRFFDRMAVRDGGGVNHRSGLFDAVLIKDNHLRLGGGVAHTVENAQRRAPAGMKIQVEVENEGQLREALAAGADAILIDNQEPGTVRHWCEIARQAPRAPFLEASGGIALENVRAYAEAGPDAVSVGALTHSVIAADIALELEKP